MGIELLNKFDAIFNAQEMDFTAFSTWKNIFTEWETYFTLENNFTVEKRNISE